MHASGAGGHLVLQANVASALASDASVLLLQFDCHAGLDMEHPIRVEFLLPALEVLQRAEVHEAPVVLFVREPVFCVCMPRVQSAFALCRHRWAIAPQYIE